MRCLKERLFSYVLFKGDKLVIHCYEMWIYDGAENINTDIVRSNQECILCSSDCLK